MDMMKLAQRLQIFSSQHPRAIAFLRDTAQNAVQTGTIIEMKVTTPDGHERISNIKLTQEDLETIEILKNLKKQEKAAAFSISASAKTDPASDHRISLSAYFH